MHTLKDFIATVLLFALAIVSVLVVERAVTRAFNADAAEQQPLPVVAPEPAEVEVTPVSNEDLKEAVEFDFDKVIAREFATLRAERQRMGRQVYAVGLVIKTFGKPLPIPVVNSFANSLGSQLMVQGMILREQVSQNPAIAFGQGFLVGL